MGKSNRKGYYCIDKLVIWFNCIFIKDLMIGWVVVKWK